MKATFTIYKIEAFSLKSEVIFSSTSKDEANAKYRELRTKLNSDSDFSYFMQVK